MNPERRAIVLGFVLLFAGGAALQCWETTGAGADGRGRSVWRHAGGLGTFAADWFWLKTNLAWERRDAAATRRWMTLAVQADPRAVSFRLNGARMLAYDLPAWRGEDDPAAPPAVREHWRRVAAEEALAWLDQSGGADDVALEIEKGALCLHGLRDRVRAAAHYRRAAARPDAPDYAARIAASLAAGGP